MAALQRGGTQEAIPFCNIKAIPITDSVALAANTRIQRVTNKPRNPDNKANAYEVSLIDEYQTAIATGKTLQPHTTEVSGYDTYYFPILTNAMCLQCHGQPGREVQEVTLENLKQYYPEDRALGYGPNEVRGLWKVILKPTQ